MKFRNIRSGRDSDSRLQLVARFQVILRQSLPDFPGRDANHRILITVIAGIPVKYGDTQTPFP
jgi:hypothetical protein